MTIRTGLDMAAKRGGATLHDGVGSSAHVGGQGMALPIGRKGVLEDRLERDERHRCLRTRGRRRSSGGVLQYHANYPRCKRLVQEQLWESFDNCSVTTGKPIWFRALLWIGSGGGPAAGHLRLLLRKQNQDGHAG